MQKLKQLFHPRDFALLVAVSTGLTLVIEILSHRSLLATLGAILQNPLLFLLNVIIVTFTLSIGGLFRHRSFAVAFIGAIWLGIGIANCVLMVIRNSPLTGVDFYILTTGLTIVTVYLSLFQIVLAVSAILLALVLLFVLYRKLPTFAIPRTSGLTQCGSAFLFMLLLALTVQAAKLVPKQFDDMADAYARYGFAYCFTQSIIDRGIDRPQDYSDAGVEAIVGILSDKHGEDAVPWARPNVIVLQLESFIDLSALSSVALSEDPTPFFHELKQSYPNGLLEIPSIGGGTANTEFEVLSGMTLDYFGIGEYPYNTVCRTQTVPTLAHILKGIGYTAQAFHNHEGSFYDRNLVYPNLGFDTYTSIEYMTDYETNALGWCKDEALIAELLSAMSMTERRDFLFAVSVQCHGKYPTEYEGSDVEITGVEDPVLAAQYAYYAEQLKNVDAFLKALTTALSAHAEPTLLILYGDHLPSLSLSADDLPEGQTLYQTEYVVWSNYLTPTPTRVDLDASQLTAYALGLAGLRVGPLMTLHQTMREEDCYESWLHTLQYDAVYGGGISTGGRYPPSPMSMGRAPIRITAVTQTEEGLIIEGEGITAHSVLRINGWNQASHFTEAHTLVVKGAKLHDGDQLTLMQISNSGETLSESEAYHVRISNADEA